MKRIVENIKRKGVAKYTIYKLDNPFPFYLLNLDRLSISPPFTSCFKYITIQLWRPRYGIYFYDEKEMLVARVNIGFTEKSAIEYFNELLLDISQEMKKGDCNG